MSNVRSILALALAAASGPLCAQVVTDGSLGRAATLAGPQFSIDETFGTQSGTNLFHSFSSFNLATGQSAVFSGPSSITNVISRVTGGQPSTINGTIGVTGMPQADFWLVNPAGVTFGANAALDVPASFYVSTADHLVLGIDGRFDVTNPAASRLTSTAPSAFGFADATIGNITVNGARLEVTPGQELGLVGGDVTVAAGQLVAPGGSVQVGAVAGTGEVRFGLDGVLQYGNLAALGDIAISRSGTQVEDGESTIEVNGDSTLASGRILVRGGTFVSDSGALVADNRAATTGGDIDVAIRGQMTLRGSSQISTTARRDGDAGDIRVSAGSFSAQNSTRVRTDSQAAGDGGSITVTAGTIDFSGGAQLTSLAADTGTGGNIAVVASGNVSMRDFGAMRVEALGSGDAGNITISGQDVSLVDEATLQASTFAGSTGDGGTIAIDARGAFRLVGTGRETLGASALISTRSNGLGDGGDIAITASSVTIDGLALIESTARSGGDAGDVVVDTGDFAIAGASAIDSRSLGAGRGGDILVSSGAFEMREGSRLSAEATGTGFAGNIAVDADAGVLLVDSRIATAATIADGGNIDIRSGGDVRLESSSIETSVQSGVGSGGNIVFADPEFFILRDSFVQANAFGGAGGNIDVTADFIIASATSVVEASSQLGVDGVITFSTPEVDVASLVPGPVAQRLDDDAVPVIGCSGGDGDSRLVVGRESGILPVEACR